jgi:tryptophan synthase alpha chain
VNKLQQAFKNGKAFISFLTAGDPSMAVTEQLIVTMAEAGADIIEIGIPFSDPIAEGPVIQAANQRALSAGATTDNVFDMVASVSKKVSAPLVFLTYLNPVFTYGYDRFFEKCSTCGISGIIIPDLPFEEKDELMRFSKKYNVSIISLIAPTSQARTSMIAVGAEGYIYCVSSMGVTGVRSKIETDIQAMVNSIRAVTNVPIAVGFGISAPQQAADISKFADGVIVGSAIVKIVEQYGDASVPHVFNYVKDMKAAI